MTGPADFSAVTKDDLVMILQKALAEPVGLLLQVSDFALARARLYKARAEALDPAMTRLQFRSSPFPEGNLVICKGQGPEDMP